MRSVRLAVVVDAAYSFRAALQVKSSTRSDRVSDMRNVIVAGSGVLDSDLSDVSHEFLLDGDSLAAGCERCRHAA